MKRFSNALLIAFVALTFVFSGDMALAHQRGAENTKAQSDILLASCGSCPGDAPAAKAEGTVLCHRWFDRMDLAWNGPVPGNGAPVGSKFGF